MRRVSESRQPEAACSRQWSLSTWPLWQSGAKLSPQLQNMRKPVRTDAARHGQVGWGRQDDLLLLLRGSAKRISEGLGQ
eukprot:6541527-Pyramimonas_sp.AAC.1